METEVVRHLPKLCGVGMCGCLRSADAAASTPAFIHQGGRNHLQRPHLATAGPSLQ